MANSNNICIQVFAKAPIPGLSKTRLIPALGPQQAASFHAQLCRHTLTTASQAFPGQVELWCHPSVHHDFFRNCADEFQLSVFQQKDGDLGQKMHHALSHALNRGKQAILIGTDCPAFRAHHFNKIIDILRTNDMAFAPADDGGYVLVAAKHTEQAIFKNVDWGSRHVWQQTQQHLATQQLSWQAIEALWDIDTPDDLQTHQHALQAMGLC